MFWGRAIAPNRVLSITPKTSRFHLTQAALGVDGLGVRDERHVLHCSVDGTEIILGSLREKEAEHLPLNLVFGIGQKVTFRVTGSSSIHLAGTLCCNVGSSASLAQLIDVEELVDTPFVDKPLMQASIRLPLTLPSQQRHAGPDTRSSKRRRKKKRRKRTPPQFIGEQVKEGYDGDEDLHWLESISLLSKKFDRPKRGRDYAEIDVHSKSKRARPLLYPTLEAKSHQLHESHPEAKIHPPEGLVFEDVKIGDGRALHSGGNARVVYKAYLRDGTQVGEDVNMPSIFCWGKGAVIPGWDFGLEGMRVGGARRLLVPPALAFGNHWRGNKIPPDSELFFHVELLDVL